MGMSKAEEDHLSGVGVVVKTWYADVNGVGCTVHTSLPGDDELAVWEDCAFTNGGPLVRVELVWAPDEAAKLRLQDTQDGGTALGDLPKSDAI